MTPPPEPIAILSECPVCHKVTNTARFVMAHEPLCGTVQALQARLETVERVLGELGLLRLS